MASEKNSTASVLEALYDDGSYTSLFASGEGAVAAAYGLVGGQAAYAVCQNGDALGAADVALCCKTLDLAAKTGNPVVTFYNSKGAKLAEGLQALSAAAKWNEAVARLSGVVPQIAVVTGVCGASSALAASSADICIMTKEAELFLSAPFLSAAEGDKLPEAGTAKGAVDAGIAAIVAEDGVQAAREAARLVALLPGNNLSAPAEFAFAPPSEVVSLASYTGIGAIRALADEGSVVTLFEEYGSGVVTSFGTVNGAVVGFVSTNGKDKGMGRNCTAKTARFVRLCDGFSIPVVTILNTAGFKMSSTLDVAGNLRHASRLAATYADATTAKVAVITGKAVGTIFTAMGNADLTVVMEGAVVAPVEPSAAVTVLYKEEIAAAGGSIEAETAARVKTYEAEVAGAQALVKAGVADMLATPETLRQAVAGALDVLVTKRTQRLPKKHGNMAL